MTSVSIRSSFRHLSWALILAVLVWVVSSAVQAQQLWQANVGAQSHDQGRQAFAFLPNELWIFAGDSITWTSRSDEGHTVSFLEQTATGASTAGTSRPSFTAGCTAGGQGGATITTPSGSSFNGTQCVNGGRFVNGGAYTVKFPVAGNYKLVCLIHRDMTGVVHVLGALPVPHDQRFYDDVAADQARQIISDTDRDRDRGDGDRDDHGDSSRNVVTMNGELVATAGGRQYLGVLRFSPDTIRVHVGETVEYANRDPTEPHTITFVPAGGTAPGAGSLVGVTDPDSDFDRHGTLPNLVACGAASSCFSSGLIGAGLQDQTAQTALGLTRAQVTFTTPGTYDYFCLLHSDVGMKGTVVVVP